MTLLGKTKEFLLHQGAKGNVFTLAQRQRQAMTLAEKQLWDELKSRKLSGLKFRRQHPVHYYIADFYCHEKRLIIEVDGGIHREQIIKEHDENRSAELDRLGMTVLRFTNEQVMQNIGEVLKEILVVVQSPNQNISPSPSGEGAGG